MSWLTLIVDDELLARKNLEIMLEPVPDFTLLPSVADAEHAMEVIREHAPNVVFLDIRMPGRSGIDLLRDLQGVSNRPMVILVTAHHSYALEAFELDARDYLVKPFGEARLWKTLDRVREQLEQRRAQDLSKVLQAAVATEPEPRRLVFRVDDGLLLLEPNEILWVEAADHYLILHTTRGNRIVRKTMHELEEMLPSFSRMHRSILVNPVHVVRCYRQPSNGGIVELDDGTQLEVSRRRWREVNEMLGNRG